MVGGEEGGSKGQARLKKAEEDRLMRFHRGCVRTMCGVTKRTVWKKRITAKELDEQLGVLSLQSYYAVRTARAVGHIARMDMERLPRKLLSSWLPVPRRRGSPEMTFGRTVRWRLFDRALKHPDVERVPETARALKKAFHKDWGRNGEGWLELALDRERWQTVCLLMQHERPLRTSASPST